VDDRPVRSGKVVHHAITTDDSRLRYPVSWGWTPDHRPATGAAPEGEVRT
jgi:hypothetical protein